MPLVLVPDGQVLRAPTTLDVAAALGLHTSASQPLYDVCIVGWRAGRPGRGGVRRIRGIEHRRRRARSARRPGRTECRDRELPRLSQGAERRRTSPSGRSRRCRASAPRWCWPATWSASRPRGRYSAVLLDGDTEIEARALIVATGVYYRRLEADGIDELSGRGVYYGAHASQAKLDRRRGRLHRRRRQLGRSGCAQHGPLRQAGRARRRAATLTRRCRSTSSSASWRIRTSRCATAARSSAARGDGHLEALCIADRRPTRSRRSLELALRLHRRFAADRMARPGRRP